MRHLSFYPKNLKMVSTNTFIDFSLNLVLRESMNGKYSLGDLMVHSDIILSRFNNLMN